MIECDIQYVSARQLNVDSIIKVKTVQPRYLRKFIIQKI